MTQIEDEVNDLVLTYDELQDAFDELHSEYLKIAKLISCRKVIAKQCNDYASLQIKNKELETKNSKLNASSSTCSNCNMLEKEVEKLKITR